MEVSKREGRSAAEPHLAAIEDEQDSRLAAFVKEQGIDQVWITMPLRDEERVKWLLHELRNSTVDIRFVPDLFGMRLLNHSFMNVGGLPVMNLSVTPMTGINELLKAVEDRLLALLILVLISPLLVVLAIGVKLSSPGPVFSRQERVGWNGGTFNMLEFRSMPVDTDKGGVQWGNADRKVNTRFGAFIRRTSLDELPQFLNVLLGDMSIVGPRPERTVFVEKFKDEIPHYMKKHMVKAGITGWAQINGWRGDTDLNKRIEYLDGPNIKRIRSQYRLSQGQFAALLGISVGTLRNWEQGRRTPEGPARVLLQVAAKHPDAVWDVVSPARRQGRKPKSKTTGAG